MQGQSNVEQSLFNKSQTNKCIGCLQTFDVFAFLPVPKDDTVSTKQSITGSIIFLILLLTYIIYDFVKFVTANPPIQQTYRTSLDTKDYALPDFAIAFMTTKQSIDINNYTQLYNDLFTFQWNIVSKSIGEQNTTTIDFDLVTYFNNQSSNFGKIPWMNDDTKKFYYILRTPVLKNLTAHGLLYASNQTKYLQVKVKFCSNLTESNCLPPQNITLLSNFGRFFLFIQNELDNSTVSLEDYQSDNKFLLYNFFTLENFYKRITINFQVVKTQILPDYFFRFTTEYDIRLEVADIFEELSVVNSLNKQNTDAIAFNMQLSPYIVNNRVTYTTIIDHISLWGAFASVLFTFFAFFFLGYNRRKFYTKNPQWNNFKQTLQKKIVNQKQT